ncbi:MAG: hypothetical protein ACOYK8_02620 [Alphaproteobacteria bacterium]
MILFKKKQELFEIHIRTEGRWTIHAIIEKNEDEAIKRAEYIITKGTVPGKEEHEEIKVDGIRVMHITGLAKGKSFTTEVFFREAAKKTTPLIPQGDGVGSYYCQTAEDFARPDVLPFVTRLLRDYLETKQLSAVELMFSMPNIKKVEAFGNLTTSALYKVVRAQADERGCDFKLRMNQMHKLIEGHKNNLRDLGVSLKKVEFTPDDLGALYQKLQAKFEKQAPLAFMMMLAEFLTNANSLGGKLEMSLNLLEADGVDQHLPILDQIVAGYVSFGSMIQEVFPITGNRSAALGVMADFLNHRLPEDMMKKQGFDLCRKIYHYAASGKLPVTEAVILQRLIKEIGAGKLLAPQNPALEGRYYEELTKKLLISETDLLGGEEMEKALQKHRLADRSRRLQKHGIHAAAEAKNVKVLVEKSASF